MTEQTNPVELPLAPISEQIWDAKYRLKAPDGTPIDMTLADTWRRVARAAAAPEPANVRALWEERFFGAMSDLALLPAGRIIAGAGSGRDVTLFNCFVMGTIEDDLTSIFDNVKEAALTMQRGGGIGHDFSSLRPAGALVRSVGAGASGPVSFMDVWDAMCATIMSAGQRRGAMMATLACDHPDIEAFIDAKATPGRLRNFNLSVLVTDAFVEAVRRDQPWALRFGGQVVRSVPARALWDRIMRATYAYAEPGVIFIDRVNARNNLSYCETIRATNPCVTGDTWVHTREGPRQVRDLIGRQGTVRVDGQDHATRAEGFFATGRKPVFRLETDEGYSLRLTADHQLRRVDGMTRSDMDLDWCAAGDLRPGDRLVINDHRPLTNWNGEFGEDEGYLLGLLVGDGTLKSDKAVLSVWWPAAAVKGDGPGPSAGVEGVMAAAIAAASRLPHRSDFAGWMGVAGRSERRLALGALRQLAEKVGMKPGAKEITPAIERGSSQFYRGFLRGFFDADGSVQGSQSKGVSVRLAQSELPRLQAVQRMLLRLGIASRIYRQRRPEGFSLLPDGCGSSAHYPVKAQHELVIANEGLGLFQERVGFADTDKADKLARSLASYSRSVNRERYIATVRALEPDGEDDVFDVSVPGLNAFDANGLMAHNCGEQPLPPYGACLLGSVNLARLVERPFAADAALDEARLADLVALGVRLLDNIIDVSAYPLAAQQQEAKAKRRIGLGLTGLADALAMCGVRYGSVEAQRLGRRWMALIERHAYLASAALAAEKGAFPLYEAEPFLAGANVTRLEPDVRAAIARSGIRNGCLTSIAPTGTISLLAGNVSSGLEPVFEFQYRRRIRETGDRYRDEVVEDYAYRLFRAQAGAEAPLPPAFVTTAMLTPAEHLAMQAALQAHVDSSISKTINCPEDLSFEAFRDIYAEAYDLGLKGCTTFRPNPVTGSILAADPASVLAAATDAQTPSSTPSSPARTVAATTAPSEVRGPDAGSERPAERANDRSGVVYMSRPLEREPMLSGFTTKLKWAGSDHAIYVTINDIERDGRRRPFEIFINTKNLEHYAWTVALTRMISAVFRRGGDVSFVVEELKAVFDPQGGQWMDGRYVPSLLAAIGLIIERHLVCIGFMPDLTGVASPPGAPTAAESVRDGTDFDPAAGMISQAKQPTGAKRCPRCHAGSMILQSGCWVCRDCGYAKCG